MVEGPTTPRFSFGMSASTSNLYLPELNEHCTNCTNIYVPQRQYFPVKGARMETFEEQQVIFRKGGLRGISIRDGCSKNYSGLERRDSRPFEGVDVADSCTLRIEWPGYPPWNRAFRTRDSTPAKNPVSLSRLATDICKAIEKFIQEMEGGICGEDCWRVGRGTTLNVDTLALVSIERSSYGSWTACIRVTSLD
ncbi:hypothetical protein BJ322DRAFT_1051483 [Thelephora terrestris]|uniref:Uncharacterized protein n=1 Tax=Thelephora terrestris TaxID=56493 RepID=A0A9P6L8E1_9AGAM|nr:hypothetical protein BJ322DRAFT_1051483 [Thelephora terrestris]